MIKKTKIKKLLTTASLFAMIGAAASSSNAHPIANLTTNKGTGAVTISSSASTNLQEYDDDSAIKTDQVTKWEEANSFTFSKNVTLTINGVKIGAVSDVSSKITITSNKDSEIGSIIGNTRAPLTIKGNTKFSNISGVNKKGNSVASGNFSGLGKVDIESGHSLEINSHIEKFEKDISFVGDGTLKLNDSTKVKFEGELGNSKILGNLILESNAKADLSENGTHKVNNISLGSDSVLSLSGKKVTITGKEIKGAAEGHGSITLSEESTLSYGNITKLNNISIEGEKVEITSNAISAKDINIKEKADLTLSASGKAITIDAKVNAEKGKVSFLNDVTLKQDSKIEEVSFNKTKTNLSIGEKASVEIGKITDSSKASIILKDKTSLDLSGDKILLKNLKGTKDSIVKLNSSDITSSFEGFKTVNFGGDSSSLTKINIVKIIGDTELNFKDESKVELTGSLSKTTSLSGNKVELSLASDAILKNIGSENSVFKSITSQDNLSLFGEIFTESLSPKENGKHDLTTNKATIHSSAGSSSHRYKEINFKNSTIEGSLFASDKITFIGDNIVKAGTIDATNLDISGNLKMEDAKGLLFNSNMSGSGDLSIHLTGDASSKPITLQGGFDIESDTPYSLSVESLSAKEISVKEHITLKDISSIESMSGSNDIYGKVQILDKKQFLIKGNTNFHSKSSLTMTLSDKLQPVKIDSASTLSFSNGSLLNLKDITTNKKSKTAHKIFDGKVTGNPTIKSDNSFKEYKLAKDKTGKFTGDLDVTINIEEGLKGSEASDAMVKSYEGITGNSDAAKTMSSIANLSNKDTQKKAVQQIDRAISLHQSALTIDPKIETLSFSAGSMTSAGISSGEETGIRGVITASGSYHKSNDTKTGIVKSSTGFDAGIAIETNQRDAIEIGVKYNNVDARYGLAANDKSKTESGQFSISLGYISHINSNSSAAFTISGSNVSTNAELERTNSKKIEIAKSKSSVNNLGGSLSAQKRFVMGGDLTAQAGIKFASSYTEPSKIEESGTTNQNFVISDSGGFTSAIKLDAGIMQDLNFESIDTTIGAGVFGQYDFYHDKTITQKHQGAKDRIIEKESSLTVGAAVNTDIYISDIVTLKTEFQLSKQAEETKYGGTIGLTVDF